MLYSISCDHQKSYPAAIELGSADGYDVIPCPDCGRQVVVPGFTGDVKVLDGKSWPDLLNAPIPLIVSEKLYRAWAAIDAQGITAKKIRAMPIGRGELVTVTSHEGAAASLPGNSKITGGAAIYYAIAISTIAIPDPERTLIRENFESPVIPLRNLSKCCRRCASTPDPNMVATAESVTLSRDANQGADFCCWMSSVFVSERIIRASLASGVTNMRWIHSSDALNVDAPSLTRL